MNKMYLFLLCFALLLPATVQAQGKKSKAAKQLKPDPKDAKVDIFAEDSKRDKGVAALKKKALHN